MSDKPSSATLSRRNSAGFWSSASSFFLPCGRHIDVSGLRGYPIDMRVKADSPEWPREELSRRGALFVEIAQYGLGCYERWICGEGERWLDAAFKVGEHLMGQQEPDGAWLHREPLPHTFRIPAPWCSALPQGEGASLLARLYRERGDERFAQAARRALAPLGRPQSDGGVRGDLDGSPWPEEYPTTPQSHVLNGAIFALWGFRDVGAALDDADMLKEFDAGVDVLAAHLHRFDSGYWSYYSLYPHPIPNPASSFYHALHINQLTAMHELAPRPQLQETRDRWQGYAESRLCRTRAFAAKAAFRLAVPRNRVLAHRLPWNR
jgi:hypothetical protein